MATLVARTDRVGDLVLATPVPRAIKSVAPGEKVLFLCSRYASGVLRGNPFVDEILELEDPASPVEVMERVRALGVERALVLYPTFAVAAALLCSGVPVRCSSGFRWYQLAFNRLTYLRRSLCLAKEWQYNLMLARLLFPEIDPFAFYPEVFPTERALEVAGSLLKGLPRPVVLVYPGGGGEMRWPPGRFRALCGLLERVATPVVVLGPMERELAPFFERWLLEAELSLEELVGVVALCDAVVSNNTGPMHIAGALKKPLVQIFDPRLAVSPDRWGHHYPGAMVVRPPVPPCKRCHKGCKYYPCMDLLDEIVVFKAVLRCLRRR